MIPKEKVKKLETLLKKDQRRIEAQIKRLARVDFGDDVDSGEEEADEVEEMATNIAASEALAGRLKGIERALSKIEAGTYGVCERCGRVISDEMLAASPESALCRDCKKANG